MQIDILPTASPFSPVIYGCWGLFLAVWIVGALYNRQRAPQVERAGSRFSSGGWSNWLAGVALVWIAERFVPHGLWTSLSFANLDMQLAGLGLLLVSTAFTMWARWTLGTMWTSQPAIKARHELHIEGPYRVTRHPIYTGMTGMLLGTALASGAALTLVAFAIFVVYFAVKIHAEERLLLETFGQRYEAYRREVPQLLPFPRPRP